MAPEIRRLREAGRSEGPRAHGASRRRSGAWRRKFADYGKPGRICWTAKARQALRRVQRQPGGALGPGGWTDLLDREGPPSSPAGAAAAGWRIGAGRLDGSAVGVRPAAGPIAGTRALINSRPLVFRGPVRRCTASRGSNRRHPCAYQLPTLGIPGACPSVYGPNHAHRRSRVNRGHARTVAGETGGRGT